LQFEQVVDFKRTVALASSVHSSPRRTPVREVVSMLSRLAHRVCLSAVIGAFLICGTPGSVLHAQPSARRLFDDSNVSQKPSKRHVPTHRARNVKAHVEVLKDSDIVVNLFDDVELTVHKTKVERYLTDQFVWHGRTDDGDIVTLALVRGVMTGTVTANGRAFEIAPDVNGTYVVNELDSAAFPTDDPVGFDLAPVIGAGPAAAGDVTGGSTGTGSTGAGTSGTVIDAMVVWTPAARNAVGGTTDAIQSLVLAAVANANLAYSNSGVNAQLRLVYSGEVNYTETPSNIGTDLAALATNGDGKIDQVQSLRAQYGADVVTLIGNGYAAGGTCGIGYLMTSVSTSFAPYAFTVVDQSCAAGYLSYAHEIGHNEGLQHDPANSGSAPSYPFAYGYQDPAGQFRTVLSYGGETRVPYFSSPLVKYNNTPTGTASQDNARALNSNVATVSNFVASVAGGVTGQVSQPCTYAVSSSALTFNAAAGSSSLTVSTDSTCGWNTSSGASWISVTAGKTGSGTATVTASANTGASRTGTVTVAGVPVTVTQNAPVPCAFTLSTTALTFSAASGSANVSVTTTSGCTWTTASGASWVTVGAGQSGSATVKVSVGANTGALRTGAATIAGKAVAITQAAPTGRGKSGK